ncbi:MAG: C1 family peptidase [Spirochaetales bacterium]|nr:C1 family peptidase [Spirochaetales bacterium]
MKDITPDFLNKLEINFDKNKSNYTAMNAVAKNGIKNACERYDAKANLPYSFNIEIDTGKIKNQKKSGRCWMFAALNAMSYEVMEELNLDDFELSQSYPLFWDKLEKSNYFLEAIIDTAETERDSRLIAHLLSDPVCDGGQWDMFRNIVEKYGVVPKMYMPETFESSNTAVMNEKLTSKLRENAITLRRAYSVGESLDYLRTMKDEMLSEIYRMLCISLGKPPKEFDFGIRDKNKEFHDCGKLTPQEFFKKYVKWNLDDYVSVINAPTEDKPFGKTFTVKYLGNVTEGHMVKYLNVPVDELKRCAIAQLKDNKPVWFGCDVGKNLNRNYGSMDTLGYDYENLFNVEFLMDKAERLDYSESQMTHAMVFTGVNIDSSGNSQRWKVENSWGEDSGNKGWFIMSDDWFSEYLYQILIDKKYLKPEYQRALQLDPIILNPWDPMGSLA